MWKRLIIVCFLDITAVKNADRIFILHSFEQGGDESAKIFLEKSLKSSDVIPMETSNLNCTRYSLIFEDKVVNAKMDRHCCKKGDSGPLSLLENLTIKWS